ncbi:hypothetical protein THAOC_13457 [Thalassiosira oceanica]|uniref:Uncharacterized protein n=1 Tax=Thalassiosira oceanica TaxID=159749 RepID=K0SK38_THAOC|nr:hypothetical protein THAOC_13457 [Thalassiosira oceanica]|eukprot:EJK65660.1 hypothetical protein THAOC_13457 [Thalassiosira oceanica]
MDNPTVSGRKRKRVLQLDDVSLFQGDVAKEHLKELKRETTRVRIGPQVKAIPRATFKGCINLVEVQFDEGSLEVIGKAAFCYCKALQQVAIPSSVTKVGCCAFHGCINLAALQLNEGLEVIESSAFCDCNALQHVSIPSSITKLGGYAFQGCSSLGAVQFHDGGALQIIGVCAFKKCEALQEVTIPSSITRLEKYAFAHCSGLAEVRINEGLQVIGAYTFYECEALRQVSIPPSVTELGSYAFCHCVNLSMVQFHEGLTDIGQGAFRGCTALRSVNIPSSVTGVGQYAFSRCANLTEVIFLGGERLLNRGFLGRGLFSEEGALNQKNVNKMIGAFLDCPPLTAMKISISGALSVRLERLPQECRLSIDGRIRDLGRLELAQDGNVLACFPVVSVASDVDDTSGTDDEHAETVGVQDTIVGVRDTNNQTAESLHMVLRLISFHELKESSILIELAMWKSRFDEDRARADCRIPVPDPAKILIMEYCDFTDFLEPVIEGN